MLIFDVLNPARKSHGFTERYQTNNFSKAYETLFPGSITWFEMPFSKNRHLDAIIANPIEKVLLFIEAKRFTSVGTKIKSVEEDIKRINKAMTAKRYSVRPCFSDFKSYTTRYGVILGDVWTGNSEKTDLCRAFESNDFPLTYMSEKIVKQNQLEDVACFVRGFTGMTKYKEINDNYNLLGLI